MTSRFVQDFTRQLIAEAFYAEQSFADQASMVLQSLDDPLRHAMDPMNPVQVNKKAKKKAKRLQTEQLDIPDVKEPISPGRTISPEYKGPVKDPVESDPRDRSPSGQNREKYKEYFKNRGWGKDLKNYPGEQFDKNGNPICVGGAGSCRGIGVPKI